MSTIWTLLRAIAVVLGSLAALVVGGLVGTAHADPAPPVPTPSIGEQLVNSAANAPQVLQNLATALGATSPTPAATPPLAGAAIKVPQPTPAAVPGATSAIPRATSAIPRATSAIPGTTSAIAGATSAVPGTTPVVSGLPSAIHGAVPAVPGATATAPTATGGIPGIVSTLPGIGSTLPGIAASAPATGPASSLPSAQVDLPTLPFLPVPLPQQVSLPADLASLAPSGLIPRVATQPGTPAAAIPGTVSSSLLSALP